jgi:hypothetical protein
VPGHTVTPGLRTPHAIVAGEARLAVADHRLIAGTDSCIPATWHVVELTFEASANAARWASGPQP